MKTSEKRKEQIGYAINRILAECESAGYEVIGVTSSLEKNPMIEEFTELCQKKAKEKQIKVYFRKLESVCYFAEGLEKARKCNAVVILEQYMYSTYKDVIKLTEYLKTASINLLGTVNIY